MNRALPPEWWQISLANLGGKVPVKELDGQVFGDI